jgi:polyribonucleotide nucleotidyltransferase
MHGLEPAAAVAGLPPPPQQQQQQRQQQQGGDPQLGAVYRGKVTGIMEFGCFVELTGFGHLGKKVRYVVIQCYAVLRAQTLYHSQGVGLEGFSTAQACSTA